MVSNLTPPVKEKIFLSCDGIFYTPQRWPRKFGKLYVR
jgi:hypothetical protein